MIAALSIAVLLSLSVQDPAPPDRERVEQALSDLELAFAKRGPGERIAAMQRASDVPDPGVIAWIDRGLRDREAEVQRSAIETLRFMRHPKALSALEAAYRRDRKLRRDPEAFAALIRSIGQHQSPSSVELLAGDFWAVQDRQIVQARIYSLGHIRDRRAVEALFEGMESAGRAQIEPYMEDLRLALMQLTGLDRGTSPDLWIEWWNGAGSGLTVAAEEPALPEELAKRWAYYWGRERAEERPVKRGDRGNDPGTQRARAPGD